MLGPRHPERVSSGCDRDWPKTMRALMTDPPFQKKLEIPARAQTAHGAIKMRWGQVFNIHGHAAFQAQALGEISSRPWRSGLQPSDAECIWNRREPQRSERDPREIRPATTISILHPGSTGTWRDQGKTVKRSDLHSL